MARRISCRSAIKSIILLGFVFSVGGLLLDIVICPSIFVYASLPLSKSPHYTITSSPSPEDLNSQFWNRLSDRVVQQQQRLPLTVSATPNLTTEQQQEEDNNKFEIICLNDQEFNVFMDYALAASPPSQQQLVETQQELQPHAEAEAENNQENFELIEANNNNFEFTWLNNKKFDDNLDVLPPSPQEQPVEPPPQAQPGTPARPHEINRGDWTEDEHKSFLQGCDLYPKGHPKRFVMIAIYVGTRKRQQVASHNQKYELDQAGTGRKRGRRPSKNQGDH